MLKLGTRLRKQLSKPCVVQLGVSPFQFGGNQVRILKPLTSHYLALNELGDALIATNLEHEVLGAFFHSALDGLIQSFY